MKRVGELFVIAAPVLLGFANVVEAASSPLVWSCSGVQAGVRQQLVP